MSENQRSSLGPLEKGALLALAMIAVDHCDADSLTSSTDLARQAVEQCVADGAGKTRDSLLKCAKLEYTKISGSDDLSKKKGDTLLTPVEAIEKITDRTLASKPQEVSGKKEN